MLKGYKSFITRAEYLTKFIHIRSWYFLQKSHSIDFNLKTGFEKLIRHFYPIPCLWQLIIQWDCYQTYWLKCVKSENKRLFSVWSPAHIILMSCITKNSLKVFFFLNVHHVIWFALRTIHEKNWCSLLFIWSYEFNVTGSYGNLYLVAN